MGEKIEDFGKGGEGEGAGDDSKGDEGGDNEEVDRSSAGAELKLEELLFD